MKDNDNGKDTISIDPRVRRAHQIADELQEHATAIGTILLEAVGELRMSPSEVGDLLLSKITMPDPNIRAIAREVLVPVIAALGMTPPDDTAMRTHIDGLFRSDGKKLRETDTPAIESVVVWLNGVIQPIGGTLSKTPTGLLKLGSFGQSGQGGPAIMIEQVFAYEDVISIAISREAKMEPSSIFTSH